MSRKNIIRSLLAGSALVLAVPAMAGIAGSKHDFTAAGTIGGTVWSEGQICKACHVPHNAVAGQAQLWSHLSTTASYTLYDNAWAGGSLNGVPSQPAGTSKLCLSCHDGTVAIDSFGGKTGTTKLTGTSSLGVNLQDDHPVAITYTTATATADAALFDPAVKNVTIGGGTGAKTKTASITSALLNNGQVECASCHDVHNTFTVNNDWAATGTNKLLKVSIKSSALCLACHDK